MSIDAYVIRRREEGRFFTDNFLASPDFDVATLRRIARELSLRSSSDKRTLIDQIGYTSEHSRESQEIIIQQLVLRNKGWVAIKRGVPAGRLPKDLEPTDLVTTPGREDWYGPISSPEDSGTWYIRPKFVRHWEIDDSSGEPIVNTIRWLCFARISYEYTSIFWRGFSSAETVEETERNSQFPYWLHVPQLFDELEHLFNVKLKEVNLQHLILYVLWNRYRASPDYEWLDRRIRAESSGIALSAHAGAVVELEINGIRGLATTIRDAVVRNLTPKYSIEAQDVDALDEVILERLLRGFGARSYEFSLQKDGEKLFRGHTYFGMRPGTPSRDCFPHINLHTTWRDDLSQLTFLVSHLST